MGDHRFWGRSGPALPATREAPGETNGAGADNTPAPFSRFNLTLPSVGKSTRPRAGEALPAAALPGVLEGEDGQHAALGAEVPGIAERAERAQARGGIFRTDTAATPMPAQPPIPESTAMYCCPSGPLYVIGLPMMPDGVL